MVQTIYCENKSSVLTNLEFLRAVYALQYQIFYHYNRSPWFSTREGSIKVLPSGQKPPVGSWNLIFVDTKQEAGVLGYHEDVEGTEIPYSEVFVTEAKEYGESVSAVASHEINEMLVDPFVAQPFTTNGEKNTYIVEICDPVEGNAYDIGDQFGIKTGLLVSDFCYPRWFDLPQVKLRNDSISLLQSYRGSVIKSFELSREGYISVKPIGSNESEWAQIFGRDITESPKWASRLPRIK